ncbi:MAG: Rpn family recombination-promoting nuclease/putative transposase [Defluviitaleaceae bacterium]|nr:Rpn family recombination-promoting nuclease/putative transposase [Defluviitaleaceae bacterium]
MPLKKSADLKAKIISIIDFELWDCEEVHSEFQVLEVRRHTPLTDKCGLHFFELPKMPEVETINSSSEKDLWLALFNAETEEELEELSRNGGAVMSEAIQAYRGVTATEEFRNLEWLRAKTRRDESNALSNARKQGAEAERVKWQGIAAENAELREQLAELQSQLKK